MAKIGPADKAERRILELQNLDRVQEYLSWYLSTLPGSSLSEGLVLRVHELTIEGLYTCAGSFRTKLHTVTVDSDTFRPADPQHVYPLVSDLIASFRNHAHDTQEACILRAAHFFHGFLKVHPFCGGNGRVARSLLDFLLKADGLLDPNLWLAYYLKLRWDRYYEALQRADQGDISGIVTMINLAILEATIDGLADSLRKAGEIGSLSAKAQSFLSQEQRLALSDAQFEESLVGCIAEVAWLVRRLQRKVDRMEKKVAELNQPLEAPSE